MSAARRKGNWIGGRPVLGYDIDPRTSRLTVNGAFASYKEPQGVRWLQAPAWGRGAPDAPACPIANGPIPNGSIMAFRLEDKAGKPTLTPAWTSRDCNVPEPPIIANGIVFALSNGESVVQATEDGRIITTERRLRAPRDALRLPRRHRQRALLERRHHRGSSSLQRHRSGQRPHFRYHVRFDRILVWLRRIRHWVRNFTDSKNLVAEVTTRYFST